MLRKLSITFNSIVVVISLSLLTYTFFAKPHLESHAEKFLVEKTLERSKSVIDLAKSGLSHPIASKLLSSDHKSKVEEEILTYESSPVDYIRDLTGQNGKVEGSSKMGKAKNKIIDYYQSVLSELITDLRIFSASNLVAGLFCLWLVFHPKFRANPKVIAFSMIVLISVALSSYGYIEGFSFFKILFKWNLGWWYPVGIALTIGVIYVDYRRQVRMLEDMIDKEANLAE